MKELSVEQMEGLNGGDVESVLCNVAFLQLGGWNALAFGLAGLTGAGIIAGLIIGGAAIAVCG